MLKCLHKFPTPTLASAWFFLKNNFPLYISWAQNLEKRLRYANISFITFRPFHSTNMHCSLILLGTKHPSLLFHMHSCPYYLQTSWVLTSSQVLNIHLSSSPPSWMSLSPEHFSRTHSTPGAAWFQWLSFIVHFRNHEHTFDLVIIWDCFPSKNLRYWCYMFYYNSLSFHSLVSPIPTLLIYCYM